MLKALLQASEPSNAKAMLRPNADKTRQDKTTQTTTTHLGNYLRLGNARRGVAKK